MIQKEMLDGQVFVLTLNDDIKRTALSIQTFTPVLLHVSLKIRQLKWNTMLEDRETFIGACLLNTSFYLTKTLILGEHLILILADKDPHPA